MPTTMSSIRTMRPKPKSQRASRTVKLTPKAMLAMHRARLWLEQEYDRRVPNSELIEIISLHYLNTAEEPEPITRKPEEPRPRWQEDSELRPHHTTAIRQDFCAACEQQIWQQRSGRWFHFNPIEDDHEALPPESESVIDSL